eukprot:6174420-Pleurochrysis_carterae.AAC.4
MKTQGGPLNKRDTELGMSRESGDSTGQLASSAAQCSRSIASRSFGFGAPMRPSSPPAHKAPADWRTGQTARKACVCGSFKYATRSRSASSMKLHQAGIRRRRRAQARIPCARASGRTCA